jgi:protein TonB
VEGLRLAGALALSLGVHAGAALWLDLPARSAAPAHAGTLSVHLVRPAARIALRPFTPASSAPVTPAPAAPRDPWASMLRPVPPARAAAPVRAASLAPASPPTPVAPAARHASRRRAAAPTRPVAPSLPTAEPQEAALPVAGAREPQPPAAAPARAASVRASAKWDVSAAPAPGNVPPRYPGSARRRGQQGRVLLRLHVAADGSTSVPEVVSSSGVAVLDRAARRAVSRWRFTPARRNGRTVDATVEVPVVFRLDGRG